MALTTVIQLLTGAYLQLSSSTQFIGVQRENQRAKK